MEIHSLQFLSPNHTKSKKFINLFRSVPPLSRLGTDLFRMINLVILVFSLMSLSAPSAKALIEIRGTYGGLASNPDLKTIYPGNNELPELVPNYGFGADIIITPPLLNIGFGLRTESLGFNISKASLTYETTARRNAALINYRLIDTVFFLGPILSYGISHSSNIKWSDGNTRGDLEPESVSSYSGGIELGIHFLSLLIGAEVGQEVYKWNRLKDKTNTTTEKPDLDFSGTYGKVLFGFHF